MPLRPEESKTKKIIFSVVIGFVLLSSVIGFTYSAIPFTARGQSSNTIKYNDIEFFPTQNGLAAQINGQVYDFAYFPEDLGDLETSGAINAISSARMVYTTSDPDSASAGRISGVEFDISRALQSHNSFVEVAFTDENPYGKRVITCEDATEFVPVMYFNFTNTTTDITYENNCITVNFASDNSLRRVRDKMLYELLGVI